MSVILSDFCAPLLDEWCLNVLGASENSPLLHGLARMRSAAFACCINHTVRRIQHGVIVMKLETVD
jgi:hypothetical protein